MSFVPTESLPYLSCSICNQYLSYFPIYFHPDPDIGSVCGRCPKPTGELVARNEVYEIIARNQKFPCCYTSNGCTENLVPNKIPDHEICCPFMKLFCPASTDCEWEGSHNDLVEHYEEKHALFVLRDAKFELDFVNDYQENCLLVSEVQLYLITRMHRNDSNIFSCNVRYIGTIPISNSYKYRMLLQSEGKSDTYTYENSLGVETSINREDINVILDNPTSIVATINVVKHDDSVADSAEDAEDEECNIAVDYGLLKELECPYCLEYLQPPIYQCLTGHSFCMQCKNALDKCCLCQKEFKDTQNFILERVIESTNYPCKNEKCRFVTKSKYIRQHEATCVFSKISCPLKDYQPCNKEVIFSEIYEHVLAEHHENLLELETVCVPFELASEGGVEDRDCFVLKYGCRLFKLHYEFRDGLYRWAMHLMGPTEDSSNYMFEIDVVDNSGSNCRLLTRTFCSPLSESSSAFGDCKSFISFSYDQVKHMISQEFSYRVRILQL